MEVISLKTPRLLIRHLKPIDLSDFHVYRSNPEVTKYQGFDVFSIEQAKQFIEDNAGKHFGKADEWVQYGIEHLNTNQLIGDCAIKLHGHNASMAEIGITISHLEQKKGYAKEALKEILSFLFDTKKLHRVVVTVDAENTSSIHLLKSTGFRLEGHFIENIFFKGKWGSEFQYAMLKQEWDNRK